MKTAPRTPEFERVAETSRALRFDVTKVAYSVMALIDSGAWKRFVNPKGEEVKHEHFAEFVISPPLRGLDTTVENLRAICSRDTHAADALDRVLADTAPRNQHTSVLPVDNRNGQRPTGTTRDRSLRHLREHSPDLHRRVLNGELSAHAAMVQGGFRPRTTTVRLDDMQRAAATLARKLTEEQRDELAGLLRSA